MSNDRHKNRIAHNYINLTGQRFGKLTVTRDSGRRKSRRPIWECNCECGNKVEVLGKYLKCGDTKSCGCLLKVEGSYNRDMVGEITKSFWSPIVNQAQRRGISFEITREEAWALFEKQKGLCALTGVPICFTSNIRDQRSRHTASLDRIDSEHHYSIHNVQWVHKKINIMKNVMDNETFIAWCKKIVEWNN